MDTLTAFAGSNKRSNKMKCPHCNYQHGWSYESNHKIYGTSGEFYELPVKMERNVYDLNQQRVALYACPSCMKTFVDE